MKNYILYNIIYNQMTEYKVGILILQNNRTYGQYKSNISYYKCISNEGEIYSID